MDRKSVYFQKKDGVYGPATSGVRGTWMDCPRTILVSIRPLDGHGRGRLFQVWIIKLDGTRKILDLRDDVLYRLN